MNWKKIDRVLSRIVIIIAIIVMLMYILGAYVSTNAETPCKTDIVVDDYYQQNVNLYYGCDWEEFKKILKAQDWVIGVGPVKEGYVRYGYYGSEKQEEGYRIIMFISNKKRTKAGNEDTVVHEAYHFYEDMRIRNYRFFSRAGEEETHSFDKFVRDVIIIVNNK